MIEKLKQIPINNFLWGAFSILFCALLYSATNNYTASISNRHHMYLEFEKDIPQLPWMIYFYISHYLIIVSSLWFITSEKAYKSFAISLLFSSVIGNIIFMIFPGEMGVSRISNIDGYNYAFNMLHGMDHPVNLFPSLHITFTVIAVFAFIDQTRSRLLHTFLILWGFLICISVIFTHQHHLFDVVIGVALAWVTIKLVYLRRLRVT